jgi:hypothetical protein
MNTSKPDLILFDDMQTEIQEQEEIARRIHLAPKPVRYLELPENARPSITAPENRAYLFIKSRFPVQEHISTPKFLSVMIACHANLRQPGTNWDMSLRIPTFLAPNPPTQSSASAQSI